MCGSSGQREYGIDVSVVIVFTSLFDSSIKQPPSCVLLTSGIVSMICYSGIVNSCNEIHAPNISVAVGQTGATDLL